MRQLCIICEGDTEVRLVNNLLFERLYQTYNIIIPVTLPTGNNRSGGKAKGGFRSADGYAFALKQIKNAISLRKGFVHTTFFDLYEFPSDIACYSDVEQITDPLEKAARYEEQMNVDINSILKDDFMFLPHVQPCESEAFMFVDAKITAMEMGNSDQDVSDFEDKLMQIRSKYPTPEHINTLKGPSKHLEDIFPRYKKHKVGRGGFSWTAPKEIGFGRIYAECKHFREWIDKLERFGRDV